MHNLIIVLPIFNNNQKHFTVILILVLTSIQILTNKLNLDTGLNQSCLSFTKIPFIELVQKSFFHIMNYINEKGVLHLTNQFQQEPMRCLKVFGLLSNT